MNLAGDSVHIILICCKGNTNRQHELKICVKHHPSQCLIVNGKYLFSDGYLLKMAGNVVSLHSIITGAAMVSTAVVLVRFACRRLYVYSVKTAHNF